MRADDVQYGREQDDLGWKPVKNLAQILGKEHFLKNSSLYLYLLDRGS